MISIHERFDIARGDGHSRSWLAGADIFADRFGS
jgi:hypothetical protein